MGSCPPVLSPTPFEAVHSVGGLPALTDMRFPESSYDFQR